MSESAPTRRQFIASTAGGLGGGWLLLQLPLLSSLAACAREAAERGEPFQALSATEGAALSAFVARVVPSDDGAPGAAEAGAAYFVDAAIAGPLASMAEPVRAGLADLDARARAAHGRGFAELTPAQQDEVIGGFAETDLFFPLRMLTVMGVVSDPRHGGNRDGVGWAVLGMEHAGAYQPPFGYYDAQAAPAAEQPS